MFSAPRIRVPWRTPQKPTSGSAPSCQRSTRVQTDMGNAVGTPPTGPDSLPTSGGSASKEPLSRRHFTVAQLAAFNGGADGKRPIYISVMSEVYDVSCSREQYGPSGKHAALAGKDVTRALALGLSGAKELANLDLSDLTPEQFRTLDEWLATFRSGEHKYTNVGRLVDADLRLTPEELLSFNGVDNPRQTILLGVDGVLYDVTMNGSEFYGPDGMYGQFAGRDASRALACMSLEDEALDSPSTDGLTPEQRKTLDDWIKRFEGKYAIVGTFAAARK
ncbi:hypothetical protein PHYPSEUDO_002818 [Phytophthora pseudosyringae]|uniref:Cytochrome b5 heme-binding domain-containing protein n=1 Tax=Phytophthora pseudosyringae TaxID=221518 RepID=A0A8T1VW94_9STRA|nr:hypothetical protein PHYPSEUDO_002818 [Phytophthora pseudosyringae]